MFQDGLMSLIKIMVVEDDALTRKILCNLIGAEPLFKVVAVFDRMQPALAWLDTGVVDMCLTDLGLPDGSGIDIIRKCALRCPDADIMVLTMSSDEEHVLSCIEAGASGYVLKDGGMAGVLRALLDLHAGGSPISPVIARKVLQRMQIMKKSTGASGPSRTESMVLTKREVAIMELIARGHTYGQVAEALTVSIGTVQTHIKNIYEKLSVHSRGEAVFEAHRRGLLQMALPAVSKL